MEKYDIFISYRAKENRQKAEHLQTLLKWRYPCQVSYDKHFLKAGRWDEQILSKIDHCKDVLVLLTPKTFSDAKEEDAPKYKRWAQMPSDDVVREIESGSQADILRTEISRAIAKGKNIVPVVHTPIGTKFSEWKFPSDIALITQFEGVCYNDDDPNLRINDLVPKIARLLKTRSRWMSIIIVLLLLIVSIVSFLLSSYNPDKPYNNNHLGDLELFEIYETTVVSAYNNYLKLDTIIMDPVARKDSAEIVLKACNSAIDKGAIGAYYEKGVVYGNLGRHTNEHDYFTKEEEMYKKGSDRGSSRCKFGKGKIFYTSWNSQKNSNKIEEALNNAEKALECFSDAAKGKDVWKLKEEDNDTMKILEKKLNNWKEEQGFK